MDLALLLFPRSTMRRRERREIQRIERIPEHQRTQDEKDRLRAYQHERWMAFVAAAHSYAENGAAIRIPSAESQGFTSEKGRRAAAALSARIDEQLEAQRRAQPPARSSTRPYLQSPPA